MNFIESIRGGQTTRSMLDRIRETDDIIPGVCRAIGIRFTSTSGHRYVRTIGTCNICDIYGTLIVLGEFQN